MRYGKFIRITNDSHGGIGLIRIRIWGQSLILLWSRTPETTFCPNFFLHSSGGKRQRSYGETLFPQFSIKRRSLQQSLDVNDKHRGKIEGWRRYVWNDILILATVHLGCLFSSASFEAFSHIVKILGQTDLFISWGVFGANCSKQTHGNHWSQEVFAKSSSGNQVGRVTVVYRCGRTVLNLCFMWPLEFCGKKVLWMVSVSFSIQFSFHVCQRHDIKSLEILGGFRWHDECSDFYVTSRWDPNWFTESSYDDRVTGWIVILNLHRTGDGLVATGFLRMLHPWSLV